MYVVFACGYIISECTWREGGTRERTQEVRPLFFVKWDGKDTRG